MVRSHEPPGPVGRIARIGVVGEQHEQATAELLVQRGENERQHRLGDPRARRQRARERLKALVPAQLADERSERRVDVGAGLVHENGGDRAPRGHGTRRPECHGGRRQDVINHPQGHPRCPDATLPPKV